MRDVKMSRSQNSRHEVPQTPNYYHVSGKSIGNDGLVLSIDSVKLLSMMAILSPVP